MCGICGILLFEGGPVEQKKVQRMAAALRHRGPDDEGFYFNSLKTNQRSPISISLGHRRLSIIDLAGGHQPMKFHHKVIVFNGEIYNFRELRKECEQEGARFRTESDTEVILQLFENYREDSLEKLNGMFAFALWDENKEELLLARDRLGIKPLYYFYDQKKLIFSSELKSLICSGEVPLEMDFTALMDFFNFRFVPAPFTILKNVRKLKPGHYLKIGNGKFEERCYWKFPSPIFRTPSPSRGEDGGEGDLEEELLKLLSESVKGQMVSDVPLGAFLSGGVDSSLIAALMAQHSREKIKTFSIGFEEGTGVDESVYAREVAHFLGTEHYELKLTQRDLPAAEKVFSFMNEPVADPTILPTAILSKFAREKVKVVLTGEGGDELFAGYNRYKAVLYSEWVRQFPSFLQGTVSVLLRHFGRGASFQAIPKISKENWFFLNCDQHPGELESFLKIDRTKFSRASYLLPADSNGSSENSLNSILSLECRSALPDRLLMKVDMASMSHSLEARPPYLDHRLVEFAFQVPSEYKIRFFKGKYLLRKVAEQFLPKKICWRRKHGFIVPLEKWLRIENREWFHAALQDPVLDACGFFSRVAIQKQLLKIYNNKSMGSIALLWPVLVLSCWLRSLHDS